MDASGESDGSVDFVDAEPSRIVKDIAIQSCVNASDEFWRKVIELKEAKHTDSDNQGFEKILREAINLVKQDDVPSFVAFGLADYFHITNRKITIHGKNSSNTFSDFRRLIKHAEDCIRAVDSYIKKGAWLSIPLPDVNPETKEIDDCVRKYQPLEKILIQHLSTVKQLQKEQFERQYKRNEENLTARSAHILDELSDTRIKSLNEIKEAETDKYLGVITSQFDAASTKAARWGWAFTVAATLVLLVPLGVIYCSDSITMRSVLVPDIPRTLSGSLTTQFLVAWASMRLALIGVFAFIIRFLARLANSRFHLANQNAHRHRLFAGMPQMLGIFREYDRNHMELDVERQKEIFMMLLNKLADYDHTGLIGKAEEGGGVHFDGIHNVLK